ncbi:MAG: YciI family protein [Pseudomonadota bacterium]|jgi:hypothetical protein|nr:YciI family protein [Pseudomonadota bacterium]
MPLFLLNARDKPNATELRMQHRPAHLDWAAKHKDRIRMAGPVFSDDGETFAGSTFVVEFDSLHDAEAWAAQDPYNQADLFASVEIMPFKWLLGDGKPD